MRIGMIIVMVQVDIDRWQALVAHVVWAHGVFAFSFDRVVEMRHGGQGDRNMGHILLFVRFRSITAA
jgi:hypothetical protein